MSTISDALKKAQKQRGAGFPLPAPVPPSEPSRDHNAGYSKPAPFPPHGSGNPSFLLIFLCVASVAAAVVFYLARRADRSPQRPVMPSPEASASHAEGMPPAPVENTDGVAAAPSQHAKSPGSREGSVPPAPVSRIIQSVVSESKPVVVEAVPPLQATGAVVRPPTRPKVVRSDIPVLGGIFYSDNNSVAIINGSAMREGEKIGTYEVVKIATYSVTLMCDGEKLELRLK